MTARRHAGLVLPLFSARSRRSWGIGELLDLAPLSDWMAHASFDRLMLLPLGTMQDGQTSPYSATSTLSIDPIYIALDAVSDFERVGGQRALSQAALAAITLARTSDVVRHDAIRLAKDEALALAFSSFMAEEWEPLTPRAAALAAYMTRERWWLDDYALFQAVAQSMPGRPWTEWPTPLRVRDPRALDDARRQLAREVLQQQYRQWLAEEQWQEGKRLANANGVGIYGDLPFVANGDSPEVWARPEEFQPGVSAGVPPDQFSETGQDWGLPTYAWAAIAATGYEWLRLRARRMAALYDGLRVDHVVGLYRTYGRPANGAPFFTPADEGQQQRQGEAVLGLLRESGIALIAEDLGLIPDFVRASLTRLRIPGCKVLRWERDWHLPGAPFLDPTEFPTGSAALTGTHDTEPLAVWWGEAPREDRLALLALPFFRHRGLIDPALEWTVSLRDALIALAFESSSDHVFLLMQDLFGWPDRINVPGTVGPNNWTWTLPWPVDALAHLEVTRERASFLRALAASNGRGQPAGYTISRPSPGAEMR